MSYDLVQLVSGAYSVHARDFGETFHPVIGPVAEAEALYVRQLNLPSRFQSNDGEFVIWDVGLGAAANAVTVIKALDSIPGSLRIISFDNTIEPLKFALQHVDALNYLAGLEKVLQSLMEDRAAQWKRGDLSIHWTLHLGDFPTLLKQPAAGTYPKPHAILFDAYSPAKNPEMWCHPLFAGLYGLLDPQRPCAMPTYSRSTMLRVTLLLAGFYVGTGHATGEKEETTIAANSLSLIDEPLDKSWLRRARNSTSAEPLWDATYQQRPLSPGSLEKLLSHPQFASEACFEPEQSRARARQG